MPLWATFSCPLFTKYAVIRARRGFTPTRIDRPTDSYTLTWTPAAKDNLCSWSAIDCGICQCLMHRWVKFPTCFPYLAGRYLKTSLQERANSKGLWIIAPRYKAVCHCVVRLPAGPWVVLCWSQALVKADLCFVYPPLCK